MRQVPPLLAPPPAPVASLAELYALALVQAETAASRYSSLATSLTTADARSLEPVQCVFEVLTERERERTDAIRLRCVESLHKRPDLHDLRWPPAELVPADEMSEIEQSALATPYRAWSLAVRHRERAFVFWTYVAALSDRQDVRRESEDMAREALHDGNLLRRERRLAWRSERRQSLRDGISNAPGEMSAAALLESLLFKEVYRWGQKLPPDARQRLLTAGGYRADELREANPELPALPTDENDAVRTALQHAEQLSQIYLDEADRARDQAQLDLAQAMAARSIKRLAELRRLALCSLAP